MGLDDGRDGEAPACTQKARGGSCVRPEVLETTGLGSALLAGLAVGFWNNAEEVARSWAESRRFVPAGDPVALARIRAAWAAAVERA